MKPGIRSPLAQEFMAHGRCASCPIIDMHGHWGPFGGSHLPAAAPERMIQSLARAGVSRIVCSAHDALLADPDRGNAAMQEAILRWPQVLSGYWGVNPHYPEQAARAPADWQRAVGFIGFKLLPDYHAYPVTGEAYHPVLAFADAQRLPVLVHTWGGSAFNSPPQMEQVARAYPGATFIMGHAGYGDWETSARLARELPNVYLDLTAVYVAHDFAMQPSGSGTPVALLSYLQVNGIIEYLVTHAGADKILMGTDLPWYSPHYAAGAVLFARISDDDRHAILHRNAERLLAG